MKNINLEEYNKSFERVVNLLENYYNSEVCNGKEKSEDEIRDSIRIYYKSKSLDPDGKAIMYIDGIKCTADGMHSIARICAMEENVNDIIPTYKEFRKTPIFFFPTRGINSSRYTYFGDRIDHTLYDLKMYFDGNIENCFLKKIYRRENTNRFLNYFGSFKNFIEWFGIKNIFTDENYNVLDLEDIDNKKIITHYCTKEEYQNQWSKEYYNNLKKKIKEFEEKSGI